MAVGLTALVAVPSTTATWLPALLMVPVGIGGGLAVPSLTAVLLEAVPGERAGIASGVLNTCRQLGGALAVAVHGALITTSGGFLHGMRVSLTISIVLLVVIAAAAPALKPTAQK